MRTYKHVDIVAAGRTADFQFFRSHPDQQRLQRPISRAELKAMLAPRLPFGAGIPRTLYAVLIAHKGWDAVERSVIEVRRVDWQYVEYVIAAHPTSPAAWSWLPAPEKRNVLFRDELALEMAGVAA